MSDEEFATSLVHDKFEPADVAEVKGVLRATSNRNVSTD